MTEAAALQLNASLVLAVFLAVFFGLLWAAVIVLGIRERRAQRRAQEAWKDHTSDTLRARAPVVPLRGSVFACTSCGKLRPHHAVGCPEGYPPGFTHPES